MSGLTNFIKGRLQALHNDVQAVARPVEHAVVAPIVHNVVAPIVHTVIPPVQHAVVAPVMHAAGNTVNAVATGARDLGGAAEATGRFAVATPHHNIVAPFVANAAKSTLEHLTVDPAVAAYDIGRGAVASATGNKVALANANIAKQNSGAKFLSPVTRPFAQAAETVLHPFSAHTVTPQSASDQEIFGKAPIQNIQAGVASNYDAHRNLPMPQRLLLAGAYGTGQAAQDVGAIVGAKEGGAKVAKSAADTGVKAVQATKDIATSKPFRNISDGELAAANRVSMARSGMPDNTKPTDIATYRAVQQKLGVDPNDHAAVDNLIGARMTYDTRQSQRAGVLGTQGGGKGTQYQGNGLQPHQNFEAEYADALKQMDSGMTGGQMIPDGEGGYTRISEHSPFYRQTFAATGRAPTKAAWLAESQRQLQSGKADSYAQAEYDKMTSPEHQSLLATEHSATGNGTIGDTVHVPDNRLASNAPVPTHAQLEQHAKEYFKDNAKATADYQAHTMDEFGTNTPNIASGDSAKFIVDGGKTLDATHSQPYHEPASAFAKDYYQKLLADPTTKDKPVLITAGGAGAGKTSSLTKLGSLDDYAAVNDTNLTTLKSAETRIEPALKSGRKVQVAYVYRDPVDAFTNGNIPRGQKIGRIVTIAAHADTHVGSLDTIKEIAQKYKDNPNVEIKIIDNSHGSGGAKLVSDPVAFLSNKSHNKGRLEQDLLHELKTAEAKGTVSKEVAQAYREGLGPKSSGKSEPQHLPAVSKPVESPNARRVPDVKNALKRSKVTDRPTAINDALLAKKEKLQAARSAQPTPKVVKTASTPKVAPKTTGEVHVEATGKQVPSKFPNRLLKEERAQPIKKELESQATHPTLHNKDVLAATQANIDKNENAALAFAKRGSSTEANATALQLIHKYLKDGEYEKAGDLTKTVNPRFTRQGQETQILAAYSKLGPTGAVRYAQHEIDKAIGDTAKGKRLEDETNKTATGLKETAGEVAAQLHDEIKGGKLGTQEPSTGGPGASVTKTASTAEKAGNSPEERLAARIKASEDTKAGKPDPVTDMVNTLHKVAKEVLPAEKAKAVPRDPMELIGQAVNGKDEYKGVYDKAKQIVQDRYKDNPAAQAELEKYFGADAKRTYAQSQVNAGVQSGLKGIDLGALVKEHYTKVDELGQDLKAKLIERAGLPEDKAAQLSGDIQKRYNELIQQRKDSITKQIFGDKPTPKQLSAADKIFKYENLGALSKDELRPLVGEKLGVPSLSTDAIKEISDRANKIQQMPEGLPKSRATAEMLRFIADQVPQDKVQGVLSVWKAGLLSGAKTQTGNLLSNGTFAALKKVSDVPAAGLDAVLSKFTGKRTKTATLRGSASGAVEGSVKGLNTLKTGLDERSYLGDKFEVHGELNFKNPVIQNVFGKSSNLVFRGMNAADQPFYYAAAKNNLHDMALAEAKTRGLKGAESDSFVKNMVANPTTTMAEKAQAAAEKAVLGQESKIAASLTRLAKEHPTVQIVAPFIKVPTNFLTRTLDFTPVGYIKAGVKAMADRKAGAGFDQRAFVESIGEATTGSAVIYLGAEMANHGLLSGSYPSDPKEQQRWKAQGITPNSIHIGNKWISMNYLGPLGLLLNAGKSYHDAAAQGNTGWTQALASFGQNLTGQSFLSGFSSFANALSDPGRYLTNLKNSEAGSLVPSWANDLANAMDSKQRNATTVPQTIQSRIPGARNLLPQKTDVYGNNLPQRTNAAQLTADPLRPSNDLGTNNKVIQEVARLHNSDPNNTNLQVTPEPPKSLNIEGKTVKLNSQQKYELQNKVGQAVQKQWGQLIQTPEYKALSNADKAKALSNLRSDITTVIERQYVVDNNLGTYAKSPSRAVQSLGQGQARLSDYATNTQNSGATGVILNKTLDPTNRSFLTKYNAMSNAQRTQQANTDSTFEYKLAQAQYANNTANKSLSTAQNIKAQDSLAKDKVGSSFNKNVRDLYGLSNADLTQYLGTSEPGVDKNQIAQQIISYGDALASAGVIKQSKFRNSKGVITLGDDTSKSSGGKKSTFKTVAIPSIKSNPFKAGGSKNNFKQVKLPTIKSAVSHHNYKTAKLSTNISAKLRKA